MTYKLLVHTMRSGWDCQYYSQKFASVGKKLDIARKGASGGFPIWKLVRTDSGGNEVVIAQSKAQPASTQVAA